jgi:hypothetical protein
MHTRRVLGLLGGASLAGLLVARVALADIPDGGVFNACVNKDPGERAVRLIDVDAREQCRRDEQAVSWNQTGPQGPAGAQGAAGPPGPAGPSTIFFTTHTQDLVLTAFPGVTVAHLDLGPGTYLLVLKVRYQNKGATSQGASCVLQGDGIGSRDASSQIVPPGGPLGDQVDGMLLDQVTKSVASATDVHVQCFGPADGSVHLINPQFAAMLPGALRVQ